MPNKKSIYYIFLREKIIKNNEIINFYLKMSNSAVLQKMGKFQQFVQFYDF